MIIDDQLFFTLSSNRKSLVAIASLFDLTENEMNHPNCGEWIADNIKQLQTSQLAIKSIKMRSADNQKIENYNTDPFKNKPLASPDAILKPK